MDEGTPVFYAAPTTATTPFLDGIVQAHEGGRYLIQPSGSDAPAIWLQKDAVFRRSPPTGVHGTRPAQPRTARTHARHEDEDVRDQNVP